MFFSTEIVAFAKDISEFDPITQEMIKKQFYHETFPVALELCRIVRIVTGEIGKGIVGIIIVSSGIGVILGKMSKELFAALALGTTTFFASSSVLYSIMPIGKKSVNKKGCECGPLNVEFKVGNQIETVTVMKNVCKHTPTPIANNPPEKIPFKETNEVVTEVVKANYMYIEGYTKPPEFVNDDTLPELLKKMLINTETMEEIESGPAATIYNNIVTAKASLNSNSINKNVLEIDKDGGIYKEVTRIYSEQLILEERFKVLCAQDEDVSCESRDVKSYMERSLDARNTVYGIAFVGYSTKALIDLKVLSDQAASLLSDAKNTQDKSIITNAKSTLSVYVTDSQRHSTTISTNLENLNNLSSEYEEKNAHIAFINDTNSKKGCYINDIKATYDLLILLEFHFNAKAARNKCLAEANRVVPSSQDIGIGTCKSDCHSNAIPNNNTSVSTACTESINTDVKTYNTAISTFKQEINALNFSCLAREHYNELKQALDKSNQALSNAQNNKCNHSLLTNYKSTAEQQKSIVYNEAGNFNSDKGEFDKQKPQNSDLGNIPTWLNNTFNNINNAYKATADNNITAISALFNEKCLISILLTTRDFTGTRYFPSTSVEVYYDSTKSLYNGAVIDYTHHFDAQNLMNYDMRFFCTQDKTQCCLIAANKSGQTFVKRCYNEDLSDLLTFGPPNFQNTAGIVEDRKRYCNASGDSFSYDNGQGLFTQGRSIRNPEPIDGYGSPTFQDIIAYNHKSKKYIMIGDANSGYNISDLGQLNEYYTISRCISYSSMWNHFYWGHYWGNGDTGLFVFDRADSNLRLMKLKCEARANDTQCNKTKPDVLKFYCFCINENVDYNGYCVTNFF